MNEITLDGDISWWDISNAYVKNQLDNMSGDVQININSGGGSVFEGIAIYNTIKAYSKGKITTRVTSLGASMASYIALAGDTFEVLANSTYMIHNVSVFTGGDHKQLRKDADLTESLTGLLADAYVAKTGKSKEDVLALMDDETWLFGGEIISEGFADVLIEDNLSASYDKNVAIEQSKDTFENTVKRVKEKIEDESLKLVAYFPKEKQIPKGQTLSIIKPQGEKEMLKSIDELKAQHPKWVAELQKEGATAEAKRITAIDAVGVIGHDELVAQHKADSTKDADSLMIAVFKAEKQIKINAQEALKIDNKELLAKVGEVGGNASETKIDTQAERLKAIADKKRGVK